MAGVDRANLVQFGRREQEVLRSHGQPATRLVGGHRLGRAVQRTDQPDVAVARVMQLQLQPQPKTVSHRQRHLQPAGGGDDDVDAVGQPDVDEFGHLVQQRVSGVELIGVIPAESIQIVDNQEHLAQSVIRPLLIPEHLPLLA